MPGKRGIHFTGLELSIFKASQVHKQIAMKQAEKWFRENPKRKICKTDLFEIRKGFIVEDILKYTKTK